MIGVIIGSRKVGINPDNVATPIAASLGDLITLSLLAGVSSTLYEHIGEEMQLAYSRPALSWGGCDARSAESCTHLQCYYFSKCIGPFL